MVVYSKGDDVVINEESWTEIELWFEDTLHHLDKVIATCQER